MKYALQYWPTIDYVQPLIGCLENKETFECQPDVDRDFNLAKTITCHERLLIDLLISPQEEHLR